MREINQLSKSSRREVPVYIHLGTSWFRIYARVHRKARSICRSDTSSPLMLTAGQTSGGRPAREAVVGHGDAQLTMISAHETDERHALCSFLWSLKRGRNMRQISVRGLG